jgi:ABC-type Fe3+/spermidine/putrescine transport system ATPase subunit
VGPSGSGKSTLLKAICGLADVFSGEIVLDGQPIQSMAVNRRGLGVVFQEYALFPTMSVFDNIAFPLRAAKPPAGRSEIRAKVEEIARFLGLADLLDRHPRTLSGGQQQRVALARALIFEPPLLLLDEPLAALDPLRREEIQGELLKIRKRMTSSIIYVTHDIPSALSISDKILVLGTDGVEQIGKPRQVYSNPRTAFVASLLGPANFVRGKIERRDANATHVALDGGGAVTLASEQVDASRSRVTLMFRPEDAIVTFASQVPVPPQQEPPDKLKLVATVQSTMFVGAQNIARLSLANGTTVYAAFEKNATIVDGQRVNLSVPISMLHPVLAEGDN